MNRYPLDTMRLNAARAIPALFPLPREFTAVSLAAGNIDAFGIDPDQTTLLGTSVAAALATGTLGSFRLGAGTFNGTRRTTAPFPLPYEFTATLLDAGNADPFGIDPDQTTILP